MIALIAGEGALPQAVAQALDAEGRAWRLCALQGFAPDFGTPEVFRIETLGSFIAGLASAGVTQVCLAGKVARPPIDPTQIDAATMPLVPRMMQALQASDDAALRAVLSFFEEAGITPVAAHDVVPSLMPAAGEYGTVTDQDRFDVTRAETVHGVMAQADVGQGVVVARGQVLAVEALPGTDWMLRSLIPPKAPTQVKTDAGDPLEWAFGGVSDWLTGPDATQPVVQDFARPAGGVFFKAPKPAQDRRIDMPVIGAQTIRLAAAAGLNGVVIAAGGVMVLDVEAVRKACADLGLFLWVRPVPNAT